MASQLVFLQEPIEILKETWFVISRLRGYGKEMSELLAQNETAIRAASEAEIAADVTLGGQLILGRAAGLTISYAPFEHIQRDARLVIVGITPGAQQAANALIAVRRQLLSGADHASALNAAKVFASFSGPMRSNLVAMLDHVGLARWLGIDSTDTIWARDSGGVHFTSALRYPVFLNGKNYAGSPSMVQTPTLARYLENCLREEATALASAVWIPLGPKAAEGVNWLVRRGFLDAGLVLDGIPHPSGANAERCAYFLRRKPRESLSRKTNPVSIDKARDRIMSRVAALR